MLAIASGLLAGAARATWTHEQVAGPRKHPGPMNRLRAHVARPHDTQPGRHSVHPLKKACPVVLCVQNLSCTHTLASTT